MKKQPWIGIFGLVLVVYACLGLVQCQSNNPYSPVIGLPRDLTSAENQLIKADNSFGFKLFGEIDKQEGDKNIFISPLSVSMALGMTYNGAAGETQEAMRQTLELAGLSLAEINESYQSLIKLLTDLDPKVIFEIANSIWYRQEYTFKQEFIDLNKKYFNAEVAGLDFSDPKSVDTINTWVDTNTNGKIDKIIQEIGQDIVMFLINAIYFKGTWTYEFDKNETKDDEFTTLGGSKTPCKMMKQEGDFLYYSADDFQVIDLPYGEEEFSMTVILPEPEVGLNAVIAKLDDGNWGDWLGKLEKTGVALEMPKFTLEYELTMNDVLKALGMAVAFAPGEADFTRMYSLPTLYIDEVKHKTFVEVGEEGTEAAAVTVVAIAEYSSGGGSPIPMRVDRPFLFVIHENYSGTILFMGKIVEPESN